MIILYNPLSNRSETHPTFLTENAKNKNYEYGKHKIKGRNVHGGGGDSA
jgi:hypothetical protein